MDYKVLFVSSGNTAYGISPITLNQGNSLERNGIKISYFPIKGKGISSYLRSIKSLKKHLSKNKYDIVHAHYSLTAYAASLSCAKPMVVSLMGSDAKKKLCSKLIIKFFNKFYWKFTIVKSEDMRHSLGITKAIVIPNGVDTEFFLPKDKVICQIKLGWDTNKKHILFPAKSSRPEKNFDLAKQLFSSLTIESEIHTLNNVDPAEMPVWMNASDVVLLTSLWEGSPNVIKEAMACCRPVVCTDVGDVHWLFGNEPGHYLISSDIIDAVRKLEDALIYSSQNARTHGRDRIISLGLDSETIALKIIEIYSRVK